MGCDTIQSSQASPLDIHGVSFLWNVVKWEDLRGYVWSCHCESEIYGYLIEKVEKLPGNMRKGIERRQKKSRQERASYL
jgi:hypothetical protein